MFAVEKELVLSACSTKLSERNRVNRNPTLAAVLATALLFLAFTASTTSASLSVPLYPTQKAITSSDTAVRYGIIGSDNPLAFVDILGLCPDSPSWGQGGSQSYSSYNGAVLRSSSEAAAPYYTDGLLLGSSISPATPAGQSMAFSQAAGYLTAPGGEMLGSAIGSVVSRVASRVFTPAARSIATPQGPAIQTMTAEAQAALRQAQNGASVYRAGGLGTQRAAEGQYWSFQNPASTPGYANSMGMPSTGMGEPFIMGGRVNPSANFITREAPGIGNNLGGSVEAVTQPGGVTIDWFHMP